MSTYTANHTGLAYYSQINNHRPGRLYIIRPGQRRAVAELL